MNDISLFVFVVIASMEGRELIDSGALEAPSWDLVLEEQIQLAVGSALGLGKSKETVDSR